MSNIYNLYNKIKTVLIKEHILYAITVFIVFITRLYRINYPVADWHSWRQADTSSVTRIFVKDGVNLLYPRYYDISTTQSGLFNPNGYRFVEFPIYNLLHYFPSKYLSFLSVEIWGRLLTILITLITSYFIFKIGKKKIGKWGGFFASFIFLILPFNIYFSRVILPDPLAVLFAISGLWYLILYLNEKRKNKYLFLSSLLFSLSILVKPYVGFYLFVAIYLLFKDNQYNLKIFIKNRKIILYIMLIAVPFLLWRLWIGRHPEGIPFWKWAFNGDGIRFKPAFWYWIFGERIGKLILGVWGVVPLALGILSIKKLKSFFTVLLASTLFYLFFVATANVKHDYYQILIIPALSLIIAKGILFGSNIKNINKSLYKIIISACLTLMILISLFQVKEFYNVNRWEIIEAGERINQIAEDNALIIAPFNGDTAFLYQTKRFGWPVVDRPLPELIELGADYFVSVDLDHYQTVDFQNKYQIIEKTNSYIILNLNKKI